MQDEKNCKIRIMNIKSNFPFFLRKKNYFCCLEETEKKSFFLIKNRKFFDIHKFIFCCCQFCWEVLIKLDLSSGILVIGGLSIFRLKPRVPFRWDLVSFGLKNLPFNHVYFSIRTSFHQGRLQKLR